MQAGVLLVPDNLVAFALRVLSARAGKYNLTGAARPLRGRQDADYREGAGEDVQAAVAGGNMLVTI